MRILRHAFAGALFLATATSAFVAQLLAGKQIVTLVTATHDVDGSQAAVLAKLLDKN